MKYPHHIIKKALFIAPIPVLAVMLVLFIFMNPPYQLESTLVIIIRYSIVYLMYCIVVAPFVFLISILLNRYQFLNLYSILFSSFIIATPFYLVLGALHTGEIPNQWWKMYSHFSTILITITPAICYWIYLKWFSIKNRQLPHRL